MQMCRRKGKWKCCLWKKSRVTSQGKFFIRQSPSRKPYLPSLQPTFGKLQTSFLVAASTHIYRTVSFHLPPSSLFSLLLFCFIRTPLLSIYFHAKIKYVRRDILVSQSIFAFLSVPSVENSRWWRSFTSVAIAARERIRMHKYVPVKRAPFAAPIS